MGLKDQCCVLQPQKHRPVFRVVWMSCAVWEFHYVRPAILIPVEAGQFIFQHAQSTVFQHRSYKLYQERSWFHVKNLYLLCFKRNLVQYGRYSVLWTELSMGLCFVAQWENHFQIAESSAFIIVN